MEYTVVTGDEPGVNYRVNELLQQGWILYQGPSLSTTNEFLIIAQALIRTTETNPSQLNG